MPRSSQGTVRSKASAPGPSNGPSTVRGRGRLFVISMGPAGPRTATLQAIETIEKMHAIAASDQQVQLFAKYIGQKPVLFDPWKGLFDYRGKFFRNLDKEEWDLFQKERHRLREEHVQQIQGLLSEGKDVGLMETGNPCLFGPGHWYKERFKRRDVVIIPGMGCDAAAMAALGMSTIPAHDTRFVVQTAPVFLMGEDMQETGPLKDVARHACTLVLYMALGNTARLFKSLRKSFAPDMPCAVVYWAGHLEKERVVRGVVGDMEKRISRVKEDFMGLLLVGRFLEGRPYEQSLRRIIGSKSRVSSRRKQ